LDPLRPDRGAHAKVGRHTDSYTLRECGEADLQPSRRWRLGRSGIDADDRRGEFVVLAASVGTCLGTTTT